MTDEPRDPSEAPEPGDRPPPDKPGGKAYGGRPGGGKPYHGKPYGKPGGKPYGKSGGKPYGKPGGKPYRGKPGGKPYGGKPYRGKPDGSRPHGTPDDRPARDADRPGADDRRPRSAGDVRPSSGAPEDHRGPGPRRSERRVEYSHRGRGPRPQRGPWDRDRGPRPPRREWDRERPPRGPSPSEVLGEDEEVVAGRRPVEEAFAARRDAKRLLVVPERRAALDQLVLHATTLRIPVVEVEGGTITAATGFDGHQGVALVVAPRRWATLDEVLALARTRGEPPFLLALDHLEDPQNVGTLLRSAEACGVHGVIFPTKGAAPISPAAVKTSAGAVEHLLLVPIPDLAGALVDLHARGVRVIGADGDARMTVREADLRGPIVIVTGSEGRGLHARVRKRVDLMARIPMRGKVASLNASVAGSVFLFEAAAQRDLPEAPLAAGEIKVESAPEPEVEPEATESSGGADRAEAGAPDATPERQAAAGPRPAIEADDLLPEAPPPVSEERG